MNLRIARKILVRGRPLLPENENRSRLSVQELRALRIVLRHWGRSSFGGPSGWDFDEAADKWCHADHRALDAQEVRRGFKRRTR